MDTLSSPIRSRWPTPPPQRRHTRPVLLVSLVIVLLAGGLIAFFQWRKPKLIVSVLALTPSAKTCAEILTRERAGRANVMMCRDKLLRLPWFQAEVTDVGHTDTYFSCTIQALDQTGKVLFSGMRPATPSSTAVDWVAPGRTVRWEYYLPKHLDEPVARYAGRCEPNSQPAV